MCLICFEEVNDVNIFKFRGSYHDICKECCTSHIQTQISSGKVENLQCPHCQINIESEIDKLISYYEFNKFKRFKISLEVNRNPLKSWCTDKKCGGIVLFKSKKSKKGKC